jgi:group I intron endonuclease
VIGGFEMKVYCITNKTNGKKYVGITIQPVEKRFRRHINDSKYGVYPLHRAISKYGEDNFSLEVVDESETIEDLWSKEKQWIAKLNTMEEGYNLSSGGTTGGYGWERTESYRKTLSEAKKGKPYCVGRKRKSVPCSEEKKRKISEANLGRPSFRKGMNLSEKHKQRLSESKTGVPNPNGRKTYKVIHPDNTEEIVVGISKWCKDRGLHPGNMVSVAHGKLKQYKGYKCRKIEQGM